MSTIDKHGQNFKRFFKTVIAGSRRAEPSDLPCLERLIRPETREMFGDVKLERL